MGRDLAFDTPHGGIGAWRADPQGAPKGALLVLQEIFGVNAHIRSVADRYAAEGYVALAPALFDPVERNVELAYDEDGARRGAELRTALGFDRAVATVRSAADLLRDEGHRVGAVGFCWGGSVAFLANTRVGLPAASYYGARTVPFLDEPLRAPMLFHFGEEDTSIPPDDIALHRRKHPEAECFTYPAAHAFNRDVSVDVYHAESARLAHRRTMAFFEQALG